MRQQETLYYFQMHRPEDLKPALRPDGMDIELVEQPSTSPAIRTTTLRIGEPYDWPSQHWDEAAWRNYLARPNLRHWTGEWDGAIMGLVSLGFAVDGDVEVDTFGLVPEYVGRGLGGYFLTRAVELVWRLAPRTRRVWLHTSSHDHPNALANYRARGFTFYREVPPGDSRD